MCPDPKEMTDMDRKQMTIIMYLIVSLVLFLAAVLTENPLLGPIGLLFLILGGIQSQAREENSF